MPKKIEYVSTKLVSKKWYDIKNKIVPVLKQEVSEKYKIYFSESQLNSPAAICRSLGAMLYLENSIRPTYRDQLTMLYDVKQLLKDEEYQPHDICIRHYNYYYSSFHFILNERSRYVETGKLSTVFFNILSLSENQFPMESAEKYLDYVEEVTKKIIECMTELVLEQIYAFFPSEGPVFYQSLFIESNHSSSVAEDIEETVAIASTENSENLLELEGTSSTRKVTFNV